MTLHASHDLNFRPLYFLWKKWGKTSRKAAHLNSRLGFAALELNPSLHLKDKIAQWMMKLVTLKAKEQNLISEIESVERHHQTLRRQKALRRAVPAKKVKSILLDDEPLPRRKMSLAVKLIILALIFSPTQNKKQPTQG